MSTVPKTEKMTPDEFLEWDRDQEFRHEYYAGDIVAMSGGSYSHSLVSMNASGSLHRQLSGSPCRTLQSDMRIWISAWDTFVYPDVAIVCGIPEFRDGKRDTLINPVLVVEVLSPSTEKYDRGEKFLAYQSLPSLKEYLLVSQERKLIEQYVRDGNSWRYIAWLPESGAVELKAVPAVLEFEAVYEGVEFPPSSVARPQG